MQEEDAAAIRRWRNRRHEARRRREKPWRALYATRAWRELRARQLACEPFCRKHAARGETVAASHVDHIRPHKGDRALFFDPANLQSLCEVCHNRVKQAQERSRFLPAGADGWPIARMEAIRQWGR